MFAVFTEQPKRIKVFHSLKEAENGLVQIATEWANAEVGSKNVQSALHSTRPLTDFPDGLCLKYEETPGERTICAISKLSGWFGSTLETKNRFTLLPCEEGQVVPQLQRPTVLETRGGSMSYEDVLNELKSTLLKRRQAIE